MGNTSSQEDQAPRFSLPQQRIVNANVDSPTRAVDLPVQQNVVALKVASIESIKFTETLPKLAPDDKEQDFRLTAKIKNMEPGWLAELYFCVRLVYPELPGQLFDAASSSSSSRDFPNVVTDDKLARQAQIDQCGPHYGAIVGDEIHWGIVLNPRKWPTMQNDAESNRTGAKYRCSVTIILRPPGNSTALGNRPQQGEKVRDGTSLYVYWVQRNSSLSLSQALRLVQTPNGTSVVRQLYGLEDEDATCVFCLFEPRDTAVMPCHHLCLCADCAGQLKSRFITEKVAKCPICRQEISNFVSIKFDKRESSAKAEEKKDDAVKPDETENAGGSTNDQEAKQSDQPKEERPSAVVQETGELPQRAIRRLGQEMKALANKKEELENAGVEFQYGNDMRFWTFRVQAMKLPESSLKNCLLRDGMTHMTFEAMFTNGFPQQPPKVRLVSPMTDVGSFWVMSHGAICFELLTQDGWTPAVTMDQVAFQLISIMIDKGSNGSFRSGEFPREGAWKAAEKIAEYHDNAGWGAVPNR